MPRRGKNETYGGIRAERPHEFDRLAPRVEDERHSLVIEKHGTPRPRRVLDGSRRTAAAGEKMCAAPATSVSCHCVTMWLAIRSARALIVADGLIASAVGIIEPSLTYRPG
jgi:hypothetical protein